MRQCPPASFATFFVSLFNLFASLSVALQCAAFVTLLLEAFNTDMGMLKFICSASVGGCDALNGKRAEAWQERKKRANMGPVLTRGWQDCESDGFEVCSHAIDRIWKPLFQGSFLCVCCVIDSDDLAGCSSVPTCYECKVQSGMTGRADGFGIESEVWMEKGLLSSTVHVQNDEECMNNPRTQLSSDALLLKKSGLMSKSIPVFFEKCDFQLPDRLESREAWPGVRSIVQRSMRHQNLVSCDSICKPLEFYRSKPVVYAGGGQKQHFLLSGEKRRNIGRENAFEQVGRRRGAASLVDQFFCTFATTTADGGCTSPIDKKQHDCDNQSRESDGKDGNNNRRSSDSCNRGDNLTPRSNPNRSSGNGNSGRDNDKHDHNKNVKKSVKKKQHSEENCSDEDKNNPKTSHLTKAKSELHQYGPSTPYDNNDNNNKPKTKHHRNTSHTRPKSTTISSIKSPIKESQSSHHATIRVDEMATSPITIPTPPNPIPRKTSKQKLPKPKSPHKLNRRPITVSRSASPSNKRIEPLNIDDVSPSTIFNMFHQFSSPSKGKTLKLPPVRKFKYASLNIKDTSKLIESLNTYRPYLDTSPSPVAALKQIDSDRGDTTDDDYHTAEDQKSTVEGEKECGSAVRLLSGFSVAESVNKHGLRRSKKMVVVDKMKRVYEMEDVNFCEFPWNSNDSFGLFCVFDGHSGKECALSAKRLIPEQLFQHLKNIDLNVGDDGQVGSARSLKEVFENVFLEVDQMLLEYEYEGTTCTVVFLRKNSIGRRFLQAANVGDSTALLVRNEEAIVLTEKHHLSSDSEFERVQLSGVKVHQGQTRLNGLAVSRALGDHFPKSVRCGIIALPSVSPVFELEVQDSFLILATDGLWDVICHQRSYEIIKNETSPKEMSALLLTAALNSINCTDNVTTVVVKL